ncbi:MAG: RNA methyltransferase [Methanimicrococcus sp.]|nr:RNA methyltransferase [Methanimicrococcus sp.]
MPETEMPETEIPKELEKSKELEESEESKESEELEELKESEESENAQIIPSQFASNLRIVLVEPLYQGNVGSVCRIMKNFGFLNLYLVNPCALEGEARAMASHAVDVLQNARVCSTIEEAVSDCDVVIGTTGSRAFKGCDHIRTPALSPKLLKEKIEEYHPDTKFALLFGREDSGFSNAELSLCSIIATIPTSHIYPIMNLSHAVGVMVYELSGASLTGKYKTTDFESFNALCNHFEDVLEDMEFDPLKKEKIALMMKRILGRADLTVCEARTLRGIFRNIRYYAKKSKGEDVSKYRREIKNQFDDDDFEKEAYDLDFENDCEND